MKICIVSKFPPIEGGISAKTYWLARGLAEQGLEIHVVTNASSVEKEYRISFQKNDYQLSTEVTIHNVEINTPWHIPYSPLYQEKLLDKLLEICIKRNIDIIDSSYLVPYGISAYLAGRIKGIPYIVRHAGSDLAKFWEEKVLSNLLIGTIMNAAAVVTDMKEFSYLNKNCVNLSRYVVNEKCFNPPSFQNSEPIFAYIGKINYHWKHKGLDKIIEIHKKNTPQSKLLFVAQGKGKDDFIKECHIDKNTFIDFIPPWEMPAFLQKIDYLYYFVKNNPIRDFSNLVVEAVACGVRIITDDLSYFDQYGSLFDVSQYVLLPDKIAGDRWIKPIHNPIRSSFNQYIIGNINMYKEILTRIK